MKYFRHLRRCRAISVVLGVAWLPYIATRCIMVPGAHADCDMLSPSAHADADHTVPHHHAPDALAQPEPQHQSHTPSKQPAHSCCDLTGKCNIKVTPGTPSLDPGHLVATLPVAVDARIRHAELPPDRGAPALAHAPPTYLRNATLLI